MKRIALSLIFVLALASCGYSEFVSIENDGVKAMVESTTGHFSIGTPDGIPALDGFPDTVSSHFNVYIDGEIYSNEPGLGTALPLMEAAQVNEGRYISIQWLLGEVRIWEKLYLLPEDSLDKFIYIEYLIYNGSTDTHSVGLLQYMDIKVGDSDAPYTFAPPSAVIDNETQYTYSAIPAYWTAYEFPPPYADTTATAQGILFGIDYRFPDRIIFGPAETYRDVVWVYYPSGLGFGGDMATLTWWSDYPLEPYAIRFMGNYYGIGYPQVEVDEVSSSPEDITLGEAYPNPFNMETTIPFSISEGMDVTLDVFNLRGEKVANVASGYYEAGSYRVKFSGDFPSGIYIYRLNAGNKNLSGKLILLK
ncbi:MAG: hypothetical protein B6D65_02820 [candidate division Zixibacteria bacterium 4484_93]|nr:MAG: hypothetical protein B6D65_02820 [candidate division Zixibacteria bacterium 4484_93]